MADIPTEVTKFEKAVAQHSFWASTETPEEIETERALLIARQEIKDFILAERERAILAERERCCGLIFGHCESDNAAQRTVDAIREGQTP